MKQFSLEEYLKNPKRKVITRDGRNARIICTNANAKGKYPIVALIKNPNTEYPSLFTRKGEYARDIQHSDDLFFTSEKHEGWANMYKNPDETNPYMGGLYNSEEEAREKIGLNDLYLRTVKIEWEE